MSVKKTNLVILGGTSAVAMAYARDMAASCDAILLVGRDREKLAHNVEDLTARGCAHATSLVAELGDPSAVATTWQRIQQSIGQVDSVLLAYGVLGDQQQGQSDSNKLLDLLNTNFVSAAVWCEQVFETLRKAGNGQLSVIGSVAGDRGRQSNYHYGAAKGGLTIFIEGMQHRAAKLKEAKIKVLLIKPGFIDTPMTDHLEKGGALWASPESIARIIRKAEVKGKRIVYAPWYWQLILLLVRFTPFFVFKRSSL